MMPSLRLFREAETWRALCLVEDGVDALKEYVAEDVEACEVFISRAVLSGLYEK